MSVHDRPPPLPRTCPPGSSLQVEISAKRPPATHYTMQCHCPTPALLVGNAGEFEFVDLGKPENRGRVLFVCAQSGRLPAPVPLPLITRGNVGNNRPSPVSAPKGPLKQSKVRLSAEIIAMDAMGLESPLDRVFERPRNAGASRSSYEPSFLDYAHPVRFAAKPSKRCQYVVTITQRHLSPTA